MRHHRSLLCRALLTGALLCIAGPLLERATADEQTWAERVAAVVRPADDFSAAEPYEINSGGAATSHKLVNRSSFSQPSANLPFEQQLTFKVGDGIFRKLWVSAPSSTTSSDGLGPLYNSRSCQSCHLKDGRGHPPAAGEAAVSLFLRISVPPRDAQEREALASGKAPVIGEPTYGTQLQNFSLPGIVPEGQMTIATEEVPVTLADGTVVTLQKPTYGVSDLGYGPLDPAVMLSPRLAPPMIGMGLLEAIDQADIDALADPDDADGDGISGRVNRVWDQEAGAVRPGRFGWKAGEPSILQQTAHAAAGDLGLSNRFVPYPGGDCSPRQTACREAPNGEDAAAGEHELPDRMLDLVTFYSRNLAVPARRKVDDPQVLAGKALFYESGCIACHRPKFVTGDVAGRPEHSRQLIWPYTDLLVHDMGEGLADGRPEGFANGREWRTPPLWGLGLTQEVSGPTGYLHDGRARNLLEAVLWHGGEAEAAKQKVVAMTADERAALLAFLESL